MIMDGLRRWRFAKSMQLDRRSFLPNFFKCNLPELSLLKYEIHFTRSLCHRAQLIPHDHMYRVSCRFRCERYNHNRMDFRTGFANIKRRKRNVENEGEGGLKGEGP